jgi:hypothetical protein
MFLLLRLILAHFIGDTVLQPDEVYELKKSGLHGVIVHVGVILGIFIIFSLPYLKYPAAWIILLFATFTHLVQDEIKLRHITSKRLNFPIFVIDQLIHILFLLPILLFGFAYNPVESQSMLLQLYNNDSLIIVAIGYVIVVFLATYIWEAFKISYFKNPVLFDSFLIKYGMFERLILITATIFYYLWPLLLIIALLRICVKRLRFSSDLIFNLLFSVPVGLYLRGFFPLF